MHLKAKIVQVKKGLDIFNDAQETGGGWGGLLPPMPIWDWYPPLGEPPQ